jgi:hypothetical protein
LRKRTFCLPETMTSRPFGSKKRMRDESRRRVCFTWVRLMTQSRVARKNVELSSLRSQSRSRRRTRAVPSGRWMRVWSPHASRSQMSAVRISQHFLLSLKKTKSSRRSVMVLSHSEVGRCVGLKGIKNSICRRGWLFLRQVVSMRRDVLARNTTARIVQFHERSWTSGLVMLNGRKA